MADEAEIIENPTSTPAAVSTGYQRQNTALVAARVGMDASVVEESGGAAVVRVSGPVDVNGVLYNITTEASLTPVSDGRWYIYLSGAGPTYLTPTLTDDPGTFDPEKNARYTAGGARILNWVIDLDSTLYVIKKSPDGINFFDEIDIYRGTDDENIEYPIGTYLLVYQGNSNDGINFQKNLFTDGTEVFRSAAAGRVELNGIWSCKGNIVTLDAFNKFALYQRIY